MQTWLFRCCSCSSPVHHWDATLSKKTAVATVLCTPDLISLVSTLSYTQLLGGASRMLCSRVYTVSFLGGGSLVRWLGRQCTYGGVAVFFVDAIYHAGAVCQCVSFFVPTSYKNIITGLRAVARSIETLFTTLAIGRRPGFSGDASTNQPSHQTTIWC